jgi:hypothetical protein
MNSGFDLNIENYSKSELEEIFDLPLNYDESIVEMKETKLRQNIMGDQTIPGSTKNKTLNFISDVRKLLLNAVQSNSSKATNGINALAKTYQSIYNLDKSLSKSEIVSAGATHIIKPPATPYGQSQPSEFYAGTINPLNKRILRQNLNIDTRFRENYYATQSSNFHLDLPTRFTQIVSMQLSALEMPNTFYSISKVFGNNFFVIEIPRRYMTATRSHV